jgi:hypothetical protein
MSWTHTRCQACETRLPPWYLVTALVVAFGVFAAFFVLENFF